MSNAQKSITELYSDLKDYKKCKIGGIVSEDDERYPFGFGKRIVLENLTVDRISQRTTPEIRQSYGKFEVNFLVHDDSTEKLLLIKNATYPINIAASFTKPDDKISVAGFFKYKMQDQLNFLETSHLINHTYSFNVI